MIVLLNTKHWIKIYPIFFPYRLEFLTILRETFRDKIAGHFPYLDKL